MAGDCKNCRYAVWKKTASGRLHPSGDGKCMFTWEPLPLPKSYFGMSIPRPVLQGRSVDRHDPFKNCQTWTELRADEMNRAETGAD